MDWLSFHVYHQSGIDRILRQCVAPLVDRLTQSGDVRRFFFLRYASGGLHLRLRFGGERRILEERVRPEVLEAVSAHMREFPSRVELGPVDLQRLAEQCRDFDGDSPVPPQPDNTILEAVYEPEWERYGGRRGVEIAEEHFAFSSREAIAFLLAESGDAGSPAMHKREGQRRLGTMTQVMFVLPAAFGCTPTQTAALLTRYQEMLLETYLRDVSRRLLEEQFVPQRNRLAALAETLLCSDAPVTGSLAARWADHGRYVVRQLVAAGVAGNSDFERAPYYSRILTSYMHMFANRLGIFLNAELYLTYLVARTCESLGSAAVASDTRR